MKLWLRRYGQSLIPDNQAALAAVNQMEYGEAAIFEVVRPRSVQWNKLYWTICESIAENQDPPRDADSIDNELRILAGHFDVMYVEGHEVRVPKRIAFHKLTSEEWSQYWERCAPAIALRFGDSYLEEHAA